MILSRRAFLTGTAAAAVALTCPRLAEPLHRILFASPDVPSAYRGFQTMGLDDTMERFSAILRRSLSPNITRYAQFADAPMGGVTRTWVDNDGDLHSEIGDDFYCVDKGPIPREAWESPLPDLPGVSVFPLPYHEGSIYHHLMTSTLGNPFRTF